jgi:hypothetical protein
VAVQLVFLLDVGTDSLWVLGVLLALYFVGFNTQEATQPSLVSRLAPAGHRGAALGVYKLAQNVSNLGDNVAKTARSMGFILRG